MKAKNYRDLLIEKHNLKEFICYDIPQKELELLVYRFLCENGLWIIMVGEVRHYTKKEISSKEILRRMCSNSYCVSDILLKTESIFSWGTAMYPKTNKNHFWSELYEKWCKFLTTKLRFCKIVRERL